MNHRLRPILALACLLTASGCDAFLGSSSRPISGANPTPTAETLTLSPSRLILALPGEGEGTDLLPSSQRLQAIITPAAASASITWRSGDTAIASVDGSGLVTAVGTGTTEVKAGIEAGPFATASIIVLDQGQANVTLR